MFGLAEEVGATPVTVCFVQQTWQHSLKYLLFIVIINIIYILFIVIINIIYIYYLHIK